MTVSAAWTSPAAAGGLDKATDDVIDETFLDAIASDLLYMLGSDGKTPTAGLIVRQADSTLGSDTTFSFTSIAGTFKHLLLVVSGRSDQAAVNSVMGLRFNADTGSNYDSQYHYGNNATATSANAAGAAYASAGLIPGTSVSRAAIAGLAMIWIPNYAGTSFEKSFVVLNGMVDSTAANSFVFAMAGSWRNAAAITRIDLATNGFSNNFKQNSRATLYAMN